MAGNKKRFHNQLWDPGSGGRVWLYLSKWVSVYYLILVTVVQCQQFGHLSLSQRDAAVLNQSHVETVESDDGQCWYLSTHRSLGLEHGRQFVQNRWHSISIEMNGRIGRR